MINPLTGTEMYVPPGATISTKTGNPIGSAAARAAAIVGGTAAIVKTVAARVGESGTALAHGRILTAVKTAGQAAYEPIKATNQAALREYANLPGPLQNLLSSTVGGPFIVLDLQIAAEARKIAKLKEKQAKADEQEAARIRAEIQQIEAEMAVMQRQRESEAKARGELGKTPTFKESISFAWANAFNKLKGN